ncbi:MAG: ATP-binding protein [Coxiellaceae bacterium]|nr:ATP-binding protein [Coxiellaceae bacterium]
MQDDIQQLNQLVSQFLLYSQSTGHELKIQKQSQDISAWLAELVVRYDCGESHEAIISFDAKLLKHAIDNVLTNALKFARSQVVVTLRVSPDRVSISIDDDGPGIPEEDKQTIFEPFATLGLSENYQKHTGLGLAIAASIVTLHSGAITVDRSSLGGCRFTVAFRSLVL